MAFTVDATAHGDKSTSGTTLTVSHTCAAGAKVLVVCVLPDSQANVVTSVTYNGVAMTRGADSNYAIAGGSIYYLLNPDSGTHNIVATVSGTGYVVCMGSVSFTGSNNAAIGNGGNNGSASSGSMHIDAATAQDSGVVIASVNSGNPGGTFAYTGAGTQVFLDTAKHTGMAYEAYTGSADPTESWASGVNRWCCMYLEVYEVIVPPVSKMMLNLNQAVKRAAFY